MSDDYEVKYYKPGREDAFADSGLNNEFKEAFNDNFDENREEFLEGVG